MTLPYALLGILGFLTVTFVIFYLFSSFEKKYRSFAADQQKGIDTALSQVREELRHQGSLFQQSNQNVGDRLQGAANLVSQVQRGLGQLEEANRRILELGASLGKEVGSLQQVLQTPKIRGGLGETFLADLLGQVFSVNQFELQYPFKNGEKVDAVLHLAQGMVPIDAKFPLENFRKFLSTSIETEKKTFRREFFRDVKKHIDAISSKYILPEEGTLDFALMYIPAENVYYETILKDEELAEGKSITEFAYSKKVIPVSPNTLYIYLCSIARGLQGLKIENHAREILTNIQHLATEMGKFDEEFRKAGSHLKNTSASFDRALRQFERIQDKLSMLDETSLDRGLPEKVLEP